jgi:hypothetical protein
VQHSKREQRQLAKALEQIQQQVRTSPLLHLATPPSLPSSPIIYQLLFLSPFCLHALAIHTFSRCCGALAHPQVQQATLTLTLTLTITHTHKVQQAKEEVEKSSQQKGAKAGFDFRKKFNNFVLVTDVFSDPLTRDDAAAFDAAAAAGIPSRGPGCERSKVRKGGAPERKALDLLFLTQNYKTEV